MTAQTYLECVDAKAILADYPMGQAFVDRYTAISRDELHAIQETRFKTVVARAWQIPFYQRLWGAAGAEPGDITTLADLARLPVYDKADIMASVDAHPPFGDFAWSPADDRPPLVFHTTSGTTGKPQPILFGPRGREIQNLLAARMYMWQGLGPKDVVHSVYGHGMINGGHFIREAVIHWTRAVFMSAGTGVETRSKRQVELMREFGATVVVGFGDYIRRLADVARELGLEPGRDIPIRMIVGHLGTESREAVEAAWGGQARAFDWYGVADTGTIAGEGPDRDGMYVWEDAQYLELLDIDSGQAVADGDIGDMVVTCLYKDDIFPIIRFNTHDVTRLRTDTNATGLAFARITGFEGRSDNMVKIRCITIFPHGIAAMIEDVPDLTGEYICRVDRDDTGRDEMTVVIEYAGGKPARASAAHSLAHRLKETIGIAVEVDLVGPGETAALTEIDRRQKPIRLIDNRGL